MKLLKSIASAIILLGLTVGVSEVNAQSPQKNSSTQQSLASKNSAESYFETGMKLLEAKDYKGAIASFDQAIKLEPNNGYLYSPRGVAYFQLEKYTQAKVDLDKSINLGAEIHYTYFFRGATNYQLGNKQNAIQDLEVAKNLFTKDGKTEFAQTCTDFIDKIQKEA